MKSLALFALGLALVGRLFSASLTLERTIPLPGVEGRIDHFTLDAAGHRLFVAALGNDTVEVVNLESGQVVKSITGLAEPQGVCFVGETNRLYVANGGDGTLRIFDGTTFGEKARVKLEDDADNVRYDAARQRVYVGHGSGVLGALELANNQIVAAIPLKGHPEAFQLEQNGPRIFVNVPGAHQIAVLDRQKRAVIATWSIGLAAANFPMALDETNHRLMIGCRVPARMMVFDTESGKEVAKLELHGDCDDLFFDPVRRQLYASCGEGFIDVFSQTDPDHYSLKESVKTENKARTSCFEGGNFYLAAPKQQARAAEVLCYRVEQ
jgi:YVTN family beta-propeller protein